MLSELMQAGFFAVAIAYCLLLIQLWIFRRQQHRQFRSLAWAICATFLWAGIQTQSLELAGRFAADLLLLTSWVGLLLQLPQASPLLPFLQFNRPFFLPALPLCLSALGYAYTSYTDYEHLPMITSCLVLMIDVLGLSMLARSVRDAEQRARPAIRYLALALGSVLFLQGFGQIQGILSGDPTGNDTLEFRASMPFLMLMILPLWVLFIAKSHQVVPRALVSHRAAFLGGVGLLCGFALVMVLLVLLLIDTLAAQWQFQAQVLFLLLLVPLSGALLLHAGMRKRLSVFIHKNFLTNKYDYRRSWIELSDQLSQSYQQDQDPKRTSLQALMNLMECERGGMWSVVAGKYLTPDVELGLPLGHHTDAELLIRFLQRSGWIIDLQEWSGDPSQYPGFKLPVAMQPPWPWLLVPIFDHGQGDRQLLAIAVLGESSPPRFTDWEDHDLLKSAASQIGNYLALHQTVEQLSQVRQFEAFNRMSAFVVHDLKNTLLQLELISKNARRHKNKQAFIDDSLATLDNVTERMQRLLAQLRQKPKLSLCEQPVHRKPIQLRTLLQRVAEERQASLPIPKITQCDSRLWLNCDVPRLQAVLVHLVENAQQASPTDGQVWLRAEHTPHSIVIEVGDKGCGMSEEFIRNRLFQPFETTKQNAGMGIGVFEAKQFMLEQGGWISVKSKLAMGTVFNLHFPSEIQTQDPYLELNNTGTLKVEETP